MFLGGVRLEPKPPKPLNREFIKSGIHMMGVVVMENGMQSSRKEQSTVRFGGWVLGRVGQAESVARVGWRLISCRALVSGGTRPGDG